MSDPFAGWKVLVDCLKTGGIIKIGLYSELARMSVVEYRNRIAKIGLECTLEDMRSIRKTIAESEDPSSKTICTFMDYFSMSELRDLLFHRQEHRFSIPQIKNCLMELGLEFCGFESETVLKAFKDANPTYGDKYDLNKWHTFEQDNPGTFIEMYQFWCQKIH